MLTLTLDWPDRNLSPNARPHWAAKARAVKAAREQAKYLLLAAMQGGRVGDKLAMTWTFHPPTRRRYDRDNLVAACKSYQDGIADALGLDDSRFAPTYQFGDVAAGGRVHQMVAIRVWYTDGKEWKPTRKGINLKVEFLPKLIAALISAGEVLEQGQVDPAPPPAAPKAGATIRQVKAP